ncbi:tetrahydromethanopterin S-methyltransferase subunit B [Methanolobus halotolerans]|uniref:Tetrahydromethanopterin S-methyltransferase subunit B n=1 Tax=Methanolobus halotolerans TaxID=2052935 RepID=A0A4E0R1C2_9EURY|nr:tetrahydromethanopterin S-methyltransferase subunit B [Methanolobus halotolerans]TGC10959.1 tetrahydromethanopterin S-methyltransferase subunit B [Methanolobus halotolerans]
MSMVHVAPEAHLVLDPLSSLLAAEREDIISYSMDPIITQLDELDKIADDLINSLSPDKALLSSFPGRENSAYSAGFYGNAFYGIIVGLGVAGLMLLVIGALGVM